MAQLVKLYDYISRYETDIYRYPSRFVRLKKERWEKLLSDWSNKQADGGANESFLNNFDFTQLIDERSQDGLRHKLLQWLPFGKKEDQDIDNNFLNISTDEQVKRFSKLARIKNKEELRDAFKDEVFRFQLNWASSTISEQSRIKRKYQIDPILSFLLKDLPDSYFVLYEPVVYLKNAPVDFDVIIVTPTEIWLLVTLLGSENTIYQFHSENFWLKTHNNYEEKIVHPNIDIKRMRSVVEHILIDNQLSFPIKTAIIAKDSYIDIPKFSQRTKFYDRRNFIEWHRSMVKNVSPIKHHQLKIAEALLSQTLTYSTLRNETIEELDSFE